MSNYRIASDPLGKVPVPEGCYFGAQTQRAIDNFPISGRTLPRTFIRAQGVIKAPVSRLSDCLRLATIEEASCKQTSNRILEDLAADYALLVKQMKTAESLAQEYQEEPTADMLVEMYGGLEKRIWMLRASIGETAKAPNL